MDPVVRLDDNLQHRPRKGQALAEFAITLPILLILLFGIIEFGRIFQAWITLQNSARQAARYASTGQYNQARFDIDAIVPCDVGGQPTAKGVPATQTVNLANGQSADVEIYVPDPGQPTETFEHLFATWYNGWDCEGGDLDDQQLRKDLLRLVSIYEEARRGAAGLALENSPLKGTSEADVREWLYSTWERPQDGVDRHRWFDVTICSDRRLLVDGSSSEVPAGTRFYNLLDDEDERIVNYGYTNDPNETRTLYGDWNPACVLAERPPDDGVTTNNVGIPWMDAGGAGDTVSITVTFNHPLITPLGITPWLRLQARSTAVNEAFRTSAVPLFNPPGNLDAGLLATSTATDTLEPSATLPPTDTPIVTNTASPSPSPTDDPFSCDKLTVQNVTFFGTRYYIEFRNDNNLSAWLTKSLVIWIDPQLEVDFPDVNMSGKFLQGVSYWIGADKDSPTDSSDPNDGIFYSDAYLELPGGGNTVRWEGVFSQGPAIISDYLDPWDFAGTTFWFYPMSTSGFGPDLNAETIGLVPTGGCAKTLILPPTPPPPTETPENFVPTATFTPDCASSTVEIKLISFDPLADVRLQITNRRPVVARFTDFFLQWKEPPGRNISLEKIVVGGTNANDIAPFGTGVVVWQGPDQDPATEALNPSDGAWVTDYTFPANSVTLMHLDFSGIGISTLSSVGIAASDFNGSWFEISCGSGGTGTGGSGGSGTAGSGGTGGGSGGSGLIFISDAPTPPPATTPAPTKTPGPTNTPSMTFTPAPPTFTWTPAPPTMTFTPQPPTATPTDTPFVLPTTGGSGGPESK